MADLTDRFALPLLAPGQAQKELFHNEALARIDAALHPVARTIGATMPPAAPTSGSCWIVGAGAGGAWAGHDHALAAWTEGGWRFLAPSLGMQVWNEADGVAARWSGTAWQSGDIAARRLVIGGVGVVGAQQPAINPPVGGTTVDAEARRVLSLVLAALSARGLVGA